MPICHLCYPCVARAYSTCQNKHIDIYVYVILKANTRLYYKSVSFEKVQQWKLLLLIIMAIGRL